MAFIAREVLNRETNVCHCTCVFVYKTKASFFLCFADPTIPLVIAGDFNALYRKPERDSFDVATEDEWNKGPPETRQSGTYNLLTKGVLSPNHQEHPFRRRARGLKEALSSPVGPMKSVYAEALGEELPMTTRVAIFEGTLDYIFVR